MEFVVDKIVLGRFYSSSVNIILMLLYIIFVHIIWGTDKDDLVMHVIYKSVHSTNVTPAEIPAKY